MARTTLLALTALILLIPLMPPAEAQRGVAFTVNVVSARDLGCSPDRFTEPDLRVRVLLNGEEALVTPEGGEQRAPVFGVRADFTMTMPVRVSVEVQEGEPGGFLLLGTTWISCDTAEGAGGWHNFTYEGVGAERILARGDGARAAEAVVVVGRDAPAAPVARVSDVTGSTATVSWDRPADAGVTHRLARAVGGEAIAEMPAGATEAKLVGLCDNVEYHVRVLRERPPWTMTSADLAFTTKNAPPEAARVLRADRDGGNATVSWESGTMHDVKEFEVHVGSTAAFTPSSATLRAARAPFGLGGEQGPVTVATRADETHVKVRTVDTAGLANVSAAFALGAPPQDATFPPRMDDCRAIEVERGEPVADPDEPDTNPPSEPASDEDATTPSGEGATTLQPRRDDVGASASGRDEDALAGGMGLELLVTVGLLGVAVGALVVLLAKRR